MSKWKYYPNDYDNLSYYSPNTLKELPTVYGYYLIGAELLVIIYKSAIFKSLKLVMILLESNKGLTFSFCLANT